MADIQELIITLLFGIAIGIVPTYVGHLLAVRHSKRERFSPYIVELYGIVTKIMTRTNARNLNDSYKNLINARIDEEMRESAAKKLGIESNTSPEILGATFSASILFFTSLSALSEVVRECRNFEPIFGKMDKEGLLSALRLKDEKLNSYLWWFHESCSSIVGQTNDIVGELGITGTNNPNRSEAISSRTFERLTMLRIDSLFKYGEFLEKHLRKYV
jgi:hypothetical protein